MAPKGIYQILGKKVVGVVVKKAKSPETHPKEQIFLIFDDYTYYELYSPDFGFTGGVYTGGRSSVLEYVSATYDVIYQGYLDDKGKLVEKY